MSRRKVLKFEASAYLQRLIGRELVPNEELAIVELVKNAYDSGATRVNIFIQPDTPREPGLIRIADDGSGMSLDAISNLFMFAGYSQRPDQLRRTRVPTGEKGIGRFAADKLGESLDVYSRTTKTTTGIHLTIRWQEFEDRAKRFNEIGAEYTIGPVPQVSYAHGTTLEIRGLRCRWDSARLEHVRIWLSDLLNPFATPDNFTITFSVSGSRNGDETLTPVLPEADLRMDISVHGASKVARVIRSLGDGTLLAKTHRGTAAQLEPLRDVTAHLLYFHKRPSRKLSHGLEPGVRVYRDGFRIEPFGSRSSDWLQIAERRAKRAGHAHIVPSRLFGYVEISRKGNPELADTTSRQALLSSDASRHLVTLLREQLDDFESHLRAQAEPRWKESRRVKAIAFEQARLHTLGVVSYGLAHELRQPLQTIRSEAGNIRAKLTQLNVTDQDIVAAQEAIDRGVERIDRNIGLVSEISKGSVETKAGFDLVELVQREGSLLRHRCEALGIQLLVEAPANQPAVLNEFVVSSVLVNYVQNAMESIQAGGTGGTIRISVHRSGSTHKIEVADDGPGVAKDIAPRLFKRFATRKTGGMGVGLYYCKAIAESHGGSVGFQSEGQGATFWVSLPEEQHGEAGIGGR